MSMKKISYRVLPGIVVLLAITLISGCLASTLVQKHRPNNKKVEGYQQKISSASVMWQSNPDLRSKIKKIARSTADAEISFANKTDSSESLGAILRMVSAQGARVLSTHLNANGVLATTLANDAAYAGKDAKHLIKVYPDFAESQCLSRPPCVHRLGLSVSVVDFSMKKTVWQGYYMIQALTDGPATERSLDEFVDNVVSELQQANLI